MNEKAVAAIVFDPEQWSAIEKFYKFYTGTFKLTNLGQRSVSGAMNHFNKGLVLNSLAQKLIPNLELDEADLEKNGYTNAVNSRELSAVIESCLLELYSSVDCTRSVLTEIYSKKYRKIPDSTRKFFKRIKNDEIVNFPPELVSAVKEADWFEHFRTLRNELTHRDTGSCWRNAETGKVFYMHRGIIIDNKALVIEDVLLEIQKYIDSVCKFNESVFNFLLSQLEDKRIEQTCGIFNGRGYVRLVSPHEAKDSHSGICMSKEWFDLEENPRCIFANKCDAYKKSL